jgi:hypothetical protein
MGAVAEAGRTRIPLWLAGHLPEDLLEVGGHDRVGRRPGRQQGLDRPCRGTDQVVGLARLPTRLGGQRAQGAGKPRTAHDSADAEHEADARRPPVGTFVGGARGH